MSKETARAKINLTLRVLGKRNDGYHMLQSLVVFADQGDVLTLDLSKPVGCTVSGPFEADIVGDNLVQTALDLLAARYPQLQLGGVHLEKNLPIAAGIGGGSADAAAVLRLIQRANQGANKDANQGDRETYSVDWASLALSLGADVPVCWANKPAMMSGIGDHIAPLQSFPQFHAVLINPLTPMPSDKTRAIFELCNAPLLPPSAPDFLVAPRPPVSKEDAVAFIAENGNDLQQSCAIIAPVIKEVLAALSNTRLCWLARMSGAGPTCFGLFQDASCAHNAAWDISRIWPNWWVKAVVLGGA